MLHLYVNVLVSSTGVLHLFTAACVFHRAY